MTGVVALGPCPHGMNTDFHARLDPNSQLRGPKRAASFFLYVVHEVFDGKAPQHLTNRNGAYTAVRLRHCNQSSSRQGRRHRQTSLALRKQVQYPGEVFDQGVGGARRPCFTKVLDPEARGAGGCVGRETPQSSCHDFFRELVRQG